MQMEEQRSKGRMMILELHQDASMRFHCIPCSSGGASILKLGIPASQKNPIHSSLGFKSNAYRWKGKEATNR
jgi:hypothetical protein